MNKISSALLQTFLIILLALFVRVYCSHHILTSDEAQNMLTIKAIIEGEGIREYFFKHPPLFTTLSAAISYPFGDSHHLVQGISIIFSVLSFIPLYLIVKRIFDERTAIISLLSLSIMPLNVIYSTWVKQDAMLLFFFLWSLYFYIKEKPWKSGIFFGIASLAKEFAWFLIPIVIGWELLRGWEGRESPKRLVCWLLTCFALSGWWYLFFGGLSFKAISAAAAGGNLFEYIWHFPWYFYLRNLQADLGVMLISLSLIGLFSVGKGQRLFPVLWLSAFYIPLSIMRVKAFWYPYLASPALAIIVAIGFLRIWDIIGTRRAKTAVIIILSVASALTVQGIDVGGPIKFWTPLKSKSPAPFPEKEYLDSGRKALKGEGKVAILSYNPILQYYLGISDKRLVYLGLQFPTMSKDMLKELVERRKIGWIAVDTDNVYFVDKSAMLLTELWGEPKKIGRMLIFETDRF